MTYVRFELDKGVEVKGGGWFVWISPLCVSAVLNLGEGHCEVRTIDGMAYKLREQEQDVLRELQKQDVMRELQRAE